MNARTALRGVLAVTATVIVGGVVRADAPSGQYATFNGSSPCISDNFTRLTWLRAPLATASQADATTQCTSLGAGWRVPSLNELETLVDENPHYELEGSVFLLKAIDANAFPRTPVLNSYWTASPADASHAWTVDFQDGSTSPTQITSTSLEVRCVITPSPGSAPAACN